MNEEERDRFNALVGEVIVLRQVVLELCRRSFKGNEGQQFIEELCVPCATRRHPESLGEIEIALTDFCDDFRTLLVED